MLSPMDDHAVATPVAESPAPPEHAARDAAQDLAAVLPTRIEAAVTRALATPDGRSLPGQISDVQRGLGVAIESVRQVSRDLAAERLGRIGDLEVMVDLIAGTAEAARAEVARLERRVAALEECVANLTAAIDRLTPAVASVNEKLDRRVRISVHTEPGAQPFGQ
jgi:phage shock protein A